MDQIIQDEISPADDSKIFSQFSLKRQRTECTQTNSSNSTFEFSLLLKLQKTFDSPSLLSCLTKNAGQESSEFSQKESFVESEKLTSGVNVDVAASTLKDTNTETRLPERKTFEDGASINCMPRPRNRAVESQVQNDASQKEALPLSASDGEVRYHDGYTEQDGPHHRVLTTYSQLTYVGKVNSVSRNIVSKDWENAEYWENAKGQNSNSDSGKYLSPNYDTDEDPSRHIAEDVKSDRRKTELPTCGAFRNGNTKSHVNENDMSLEPVSSAVRSQESDGSHITLNQNNLTESISLDDFHGAREEAATQPGSETAEHEKETEKPVRSRVAAEGDNGRGPFTVIDPTIWRETVRESGENRCNSECAAGTKLPQSVTLREMEMPPLLSYHVKPRQWVETADQTARFYKPSRTQQNENEKKAVSQLHALSKSCLFATVETHIIEHEDSCQRRSSLAKLVPSGEEGKGRLDIVGNQFKEQEVECLQTKWAQAVGTTEIYERKLASVKLRNTESESESKELQRNKNTRTLVSVLSVSEWTGATITKVDEKLPLPQDDYAENQLSVTDESVFVMVTSTEEKNRKGVTEMETSLKCDADLQLHCEHGGLTELSEDRCVSVISELNEVASGVKNDGNKLHCMSEQQDKSDKFTDKNKRGLERTEEPLALPLSDAVVPGSHDSIGRCRFQPVEEKLTARIRHDKFSSVPSAITLRKCLPEGFDNFEKTQLPLDDDDDADAGLSSRPPHTSLARQLLKTQTSLFGADTDKKWGLPKQQEDVFEEVHQMEKMPDGLLVGNTNCTELIDDINTPAQMEHLHLEAHHIQDWNPRSMSTSDGNCYPSTEVKKQFDLVIKELDLFFDISRHDSLGNRERRPCNKASERESSNDKNRLRNPELDLHGNLSDSDDGSLGTSGPVVSGVTGRPSGEQEVPCGSQLYQEASACTAVDKKDAQEKNRTMWSPCFMYPVLPEQHQGLQAKRLEPLRTCSRPIRVGLSKRAKTRRLHRPSPYK